MILGLRMREGIELTEHMYNNYRHTIDKFTEMGFLDKGKGRIAISRKGLFVSNQILSEFV